MDIKDARKIIKDLSEKTFICSEYYIETESGYVITTKEKQKYARSKKQTNADRIRNMTDEEFAEAIIHNRNSCDCCIPIMHGKACVGSCANSVLRWLQAEVKEGADDE